jgi:two-component system, NarL family, sensor histidine kinase UhpB
MAQYTTPHLQAGINKALVNAVNAVILILNPDSTIQFYSKGAEHLMGYTVQDVSGKLWFKVWINPAEQEAYKTKFHPITPGLIPPDNENPIICANGTEKMIHWQNIDLYEGTKFTGVLCIGRDVTTQRTIENKLQAINNRFQLIANVTNDVIWDWNKQTNTMWWNDNFFNYFGYPKTPESNTIEAWENGLHPEDRERVIDSFYQSIQEKKQKWVEEYRFLKADGSIVHILDRGYIILNNEGQAERMVGSMMDITQRKNAEQAQQQANHKLRELAAYLQQVREQERKYMAREIHDQFGQMVTALKMDVSWIHKKVADTHPELKERMNETIELLNNMVNTVRRIAQELRPAVLDDLGLVAAMEWQCKDFEKRTGIKVNLINTAGEPLLTNDIQTGLFRIFQETLTNIMRHAKATMVHCKLGLNNNLLVLAIQDNGIGFEVKDKQNTLGLLGMKERAIMINAQLFIESLPNNGTTITISVPIN